MLILPTCPAVAKWDELNEMADACRTAAKEKNAGLANIHAALKKAGETDRAKLFSDGVHLSPIGQEVVANTVIEALKAAK